jgi:hypothetical protein
MSNPRMNEEKEQSVTAEFKDLTDANDLSEGLILVSVGNPDYEGTNLSAIVSLLNLHHEKNPTFKKIDALIAGTLQRHNFWSFSSKLSDEKLKELLQDISDDVDLNELSEIFAKKFRPAAEQLESEYIKNNIAQYESLNDIQVRIIKWDQELNTASDKVHHVTHHTEYDRLYAEIKSNYESKDDFKKSFDTTISVHLRTKEDLIKKESIRIAKLVHGLEKFLLDPMALARICCRNYLFEECPLLIPLLSSRGYKEILYPGSMSTALKATKELFNSQISYIKITFEKKKKEKINHSKPEPIPYNVELPIFRFKHKDLVEVDKDQLRTVTARFAALKASYSLEESDKYELDCKKYEKSNKYSALLHAKAFANAALRCYWDGEFSKAIQYYLDAIFIDESSSPICLLRIKYLKSFTPDQNFQSRTDEELNHSLSYHNVSMYLNVNSRWEVLVKELSATERELLNTLSRKWESISVYECLLMTRLLIAKGDDHISKKEYAKGLDYYKDAKFNDDNKSDYTQLADERIKKVTELLRPNLQYENMLLFFKNQPSLSKVIHDFDEIPSYLQKHKDRYQRSTVADQLIHKGTLFNTNELARKYKVDFNFEFTIFTILTLAHALALEARADDEMEWKYHRFDPIDLYQTALCIIDFISQIWSQVSSEKTTVARARIISKIVTAVKYKSVKSLNSADADEFNQLIQGAFNHIKYPRGAFSNIGISQKNEVLVNYNLTLKNLFENLYKIEDPEKDPGFLYWEQPILFKHVIANTITEMMKVELPNTETKINDLYIPLFNYVNNSPALSIPDDSTLVDNNISKHFSSMQTSAIKIKLLSLISSEATNYLQLLLVRLKRTCVNEHITYKDILEIIHYAKELPLFANQSSSWPSFFLRAESPYIRSLNKLLESIKDDYEIGYFVGLSAAQANRQI